MVDWNTHVPNRAMQARLTAFAAFVLLLLSICSFASPPRAPGPSGSTGLKSNSKDTEPSLLPISIDYPEDGSIFPPGITAPTFLWRDAAGTSWSIDISFADKTARIHVLTKGERMHIGPIDPACIDDAEDQPRLTAQQAATWTWTPDSATWAVIQAHLDRGNGHRNRLSWWPGGILTLEGNHFYLSRPSRCADFLP